MRYLICGGRDFVDCVLFERTMASLKTTPTLIVSGGARGADTMAIRYADRMNIPKLVFLADWGKYGKAAGSIRNKQMLNEGKPDVILAFPGGVGTANMLKQAGLINIRVIKVGKQS